MLDHPVSQTITRQEKQRKRQRRFRERQLAGDVFVGTTFTPVETAKLHQLGYLDDGELEDRAKIAAALHEMLNKIEDA